VTQSPVEDVTQLNERLAAYLAAGGDDVDIELSERGVRVLGRGDIELARVPLRVGRVQIRRAGEVRLAAAATSRGL
jgi:hypothetical protein